jgi:hypothetical protein
MILLQVQFSFVTKLRLKASTVLNKTQVQFYFLTKLRLKASTVLNKTLSLNIGPKAIKQTLIMIIFYKILSNNYRVQPRS